MALAIVRTVSLTVTEIQVLFTDNIDPNIGVNNVVVSSLLDSVEDPDIVSVSVEDDIVTVRFRALFPNVQYTVAFVSTDEQPFRDINGNRITEDGVRNKFFITSPGENDSPIRDSMIDNIPDGVYELDEPSTVRTLITTTAGRIQQAKDVLDTVHSNNYISVTVEDRIVTRDDGPTDRFVDGGVFEVLRVATTPTGGKVDGTLEFDENRLNSFKFQSTTIVNSIIGSLTQDPISLQSRDVISERVTSDSDEANFFDGFKIKVANRPIIQVISVTLVRDNEPIEYDIERFGYTLRDNRYDTNTASINVNLADNEVELSVSSLTGQQGGFVRPKANDVILISYVYKRLGRDVVPESVQLSNVEEAVREVTPAIINQFSLNHAPIVLSNDTIPSTGGVEFLNTQAANGQPPFSTIHPAFTRELKFDLLRLPSKVGEYSINYETGEVYVFGADANNDGTGESPPAANYFYRQVYTPDLDFTFNGDRDEFAVVSSRNIHGMDAKISFSYEDTFAEGEDYRVLSHVEVLNERVNNKLIDDFRIETNEFPVTDVFRILNETTGELYTPLRFNESSITFTGRNAPRQRDIDRERVNFTRVPQEVLFISDETTNVFGLRVLIINLANNGIIGDQGRFIGANFNSSLLFSRDDIFARERFFENRLFSSVQTNIDRMQNIGDYMVDYVNGIIYVAATSAQDTDLGDVTYLHKHITTRNRHILGVNNIYRSASVLQPNSVTYGIGSITDTTVDPLGLEQVGERFINDNPTRPLIVGTYQSGEDGITNSGETLFTANSAVFTQDDIQRTLTVGSSNKPPVQAVTITGIVNEKQVIVDTAFTNTVKGRVWAITDTSTGAAKTITLANDIISVQNIYSVGQLGTVVASELDGYFDINNDIVDGNVITLSENNSLQVGDAVMVVYNYGDVFVDYRHLRDELVVSYEYGNNSLDWSISGALNTGDQYFVTYKYGALRDALLTNFGALTQIKELTTFSPTLDREIYRSVVAGTLQSFLEGPTIPSIERLVEAFTDVTPRITETAFSNWVLGRDFLHPRKMIASGDPSFDLGRFNNGIVLESGQHIEVPALMHFRLDEGTLEAWVRPTWKGLSNDATITFDLEIDGYKDPEKVFIGFTGDNPTTIPFSLNINDADQTVFSEPSNIDSDDTGYFIWFDEFADSWNIRWKEHRDQTHNFTGTISSTGEFYNVLKPVGPDGYEINEVTDVITSTIQSIKFNAFIDGYDEIANSTTYAQDGLAFASGDIHYLFDMAQSDSANRVSIFKDGTGYLNFQVWDNRATMMPDAGFYNMSTNVRDWEANELHHIAVSWKFNTSFEKDEMHLFVDGEEVPNLFKYGGNPKASSSYDFGDVAEEPVIVNSNRPIVGGFDGVSESGSNLFRSVDTDFEARGILPGDVFRILGDVPDGDGDPNFGLPYSVTGVGGNNITLDRALTTTLSNLQFSVNQVTTTVSTPVNFQDIIITATDSDGNERELVGVDGAESDYSIRRGDDHTHVLTITDGVNLYDDVVIKPLGLLFRRCRERIYNYGSTDEIRVNAAAPVTLDDVKITAIIIPRTLLTTGGGSGLVGTIIGAQLINLLQSFFENTCQPSNTSAGRKLAVYLTGDNINYSIPGNQVIISGETYSGAFQETLLFTENGTVVTSEYWKRIDSITVSVIPIDATQPLGTIEVRENKPLTVSENNGDFAEVVDYSNGLLKLETFGTGGDPFYLNACTYEIDYPSFLRIRLDGQPDVFFIGSDHNVANNFDGNIDEFRILDSFSEDTRVGEELNVGDRSITTDFNFPQAFEPDNNAILLMHMDDNVEDSSRFIDRYDSGFETAPSVNDNFGTAVKFDKGNPYIISNAGTVFNNNEGSIEFWVSPLDDSKNDPNFHYYVDMTSVVQEDLESVSSTSVITSQRIREVESVRLQSDVFNTGTNYFTGGTVSNLDRQTITLGVPLPAQNVPVKVTYVPLSSRGDRVSIFRDPTGAINFFMKASGVEHIISVPMSWDRHTWHRIMVMWRTNTLNNQDRLRLFVDGSERGTIRYGTGLIYGTGVIYGQAEVRPGVNRFLVDNIDMTDTFSRIYVGSDVFGRQSARARMDNLRFSEIERLQSIKVTSNDTFDVNYTANIKFANPVVEDVHTTGIFNFEKAEEIIQFLTTIINAERGIFRFEVDVIDSFDKVIGNEELEDLLVKLVNTIKPAHTEAIIRFVE